MKADSIKIPESYSLLKTGISQSLFSKWLKCPQAFAYSVNLWRSKMGGKTTGFGSITHEALDKIYSFFRDKKKLPSQRKIDDWIEEYITENREDLSELDDQTLEIYKVKISALLECYIEFYPEDWKKKQWIALEEEFDVVFMDLARLLGKIDGLFREKKLLNLFETKTKGRISEALLMDLLDLNLQILFYSIATELHLGEMPKAVCYNILRRSDHKVKEGESLPAFRKRYLEIIRKDPNHFFMRYVTVFTERQIENFKRDLEKCFKAIDSGVVYRNYANCDHKFPCRYRHACVSNSMKNYIKGDKLFPELGGINANNEENQKKRKRKKRRKKS